LLQIEPGKVAVLIEPGKVAGCWKCQTIGMIHSTFAYSAEPHEKGTRLTLEIDYTIPIPVLGRLAEHIVLALTNVKERLENWEAPAAIESERRAARPR
jgi:hypothetical protein